MGQAKARGTREERVVLAQERRLREIAERNRLEQERQARLAQQREAAREERRKQGLPEVPPKRRQVHTGFGTSRLALFAALGMAASLGAAVPAPSPIDCIRDDFPSPTDRRNRRR